MADVREFRNIIDNDLMSLRFLLKSKIASFDEIKKEEEMLIESVKNVMAQVKEMENVLEKEISMFRKIAGGWGKAYANKRWDVIGKAVQAELNDFSEEFTKTKKMYKGCAAMHKRLSDLVVMLKGMNSKNKETRHKQLQLIEDFRKQKRGDY